MLDLNVKPAAILTWLRNQKPVRLTGGKIVWLGGHVHPTEPIIMAYEDNPIKTNKRERNCVAIRFEDIECLLT